MSDWSDPKLLVDVAWKVGTLGGFVWLGIQNRIKANKHALAQLHDDLGGLGTRLTKVEEKQRLAPSHDDLEKLHDRISQVRNEQSKVARDISTIGSEVTGIAKNVDLLLQYHLPPGGGAKK